MPRSVSTPEARRSVGGRHGGLCAARSAPVRCRSVRCVAVRADRPARLLSRYRLACAPAYRRHNGVDSGRQQIPSDYAACGWSSGAGWRCSDPQSGSGDLSAAAWRGCRTRSRTMPTAGHAPSSSTAWALRRGLLYCKSAPGPPFVMITAANATRSITPMRRRQSRVMTVCGRAGVGVRYVVRSARRYLFEVCAPSMK